MWTLLLHLLLGWYLVLHRSAKDCSLIYKPPENKFHLPAKNWFKPHLLTLLELEGTSVKNKKQKLVNKWLFIFVCTAPEWPSLVLH